LYVFPRGRASLLGDFETRVAGPSAGVVAGPTSAAPSGPGTLGPAAVGPAAASPNNRLRDFGLGAQVLTDLGCGKIRLMTNNPRRVVGASGYGLDIVECLTIRASAKVVALREQEG